MRMCACVYVCVWGVYVIRVCMCVYQCSFSVCLCVYVNVSHGEMKVDGHLFLFYFLVANIDRMCVFVRVSVWICVCMCVYCVYVCLF